MWLNCIISTSIFFHTMFMLIYILLIKCILIIHNTLLRLALKDYKVHRNSQKIFLQLNLLLSSYYGTSAARHNYNKHNYVINYFYDIFMPPATTCHMSRDFVWLAERLSFAWALELRSTVGVRRCCLVHLVLITSYTCCKPKQSSYLTPQRTNHARELLTYCPQLRSFLYPNPRGRPCSNKRRGSSGSGVSTID
jgi:hypothetical protein